MKTRTRTRAQQRKINFIVWTVAGLAGLATSTDALMLIFGLSQAVQYTFNIATFCFIIPGAIALSDVCEWAHPEFYTEEELKRKGR